MRRKEWSERIKDRDHHLCKVCGASGIHAHHILPVGYTPSLTFKLSNGVTLCKTCHRLAHRNWSGAFGGHKYDAQRAFNELSARSINKGNDRLIGALVVGDTINSIKALNEKGFIEEAQKEKDGLTRICQLLNCQPGDLVEYIEE